MHHDRTHRAEPGVQMGNTRKLIAFDVDRGGTGFHQVFRHVALEVRQQLHFLLHLRRVVVNVHVRFGALLIDKVDIAERESFDHLRSRKQAKPNLQSVGEHDQLGGVVEHDSHAFVAQLIPEAVLVAVVDPLGHPEQGLHRRIGVFIVEIDRQLRRLRGNQFAQFLVQVLDVGSVALVVPRHGSGSGDGIVQVVLEERRLESGVV